jgi:hypothetical protein
MNMGHAACPKKINAHFGMKSPIWETFGNFSRAERVSASEECRKDYETHESMSTTK